MLKRWLVRPSGASVIKSGLATGIITLIDRHFIHDPTTIVIFSWVSFILIPIGIALVLFERD